MKAKTIAVVSVPCDEVMNVEDDEPELRMNDFCQFFADEYYKMDRLLYTPCEFLDLVSMAYGVVDSSFTEIIVLLNGYIHSSCDYDRVFVQFSLK